MTSMTLDPGGEDRMPLLGSTDQTAKRRSWVCGLAPLTFEPGEGARCDSCIHLC
jgi:hypothetical protein